MDLHGHVPGSKVSPRLGWVTKLHLPNKGSLAEAKQACTQNQKKQARLCLKSRHSNSGTQRTYKARPLVSAWLRKYLSLFELLEGERNSYRCLMRKFAKSALGQFKRTCSSFFTQCQLQLVQILSWSGSLCCCCRRRSIFKL